MAPRSTSNEEAELWNKLVETANKLSDGHLTVMKLKTNWRVGFFTPNKREDIDLMAAGKTFADAARMALEISVEELWPDRDPASRNNPDAEIIANKRINTRRFPPPWSVERHKSSVPKVTALFPISASVVSSWWMGVIAVFYLWLVDESAATRTPAKEPPDPSASYNALPSCDSEIDAIGLFNKRQRVRSPSICRFPDF